MPRISTLLTLLVLAGLLAPPGAEASRLSPARFAQLEDGRALWVKRDQLTTPERVSRMVDDAAENGYTTLFVQIRGRGDAWYLSRFVPRATLLKKAVNGDGTPFDPLDHVIKRAHARGIEVHAWVNAMLAWSGDASPEDPNHILNLHPDWSAVDATGRPLSDYSTRDVQKANIEGVFLAAGNPEVREHIRAVVHEIASTYPVDGIHLDYIRCPLVDSGYDRASRSAFAAEHGVDPWKLRHGVSGLEARFGKEGVAALEQQWRTWRAEQVTRLVGDIRNDLDTIGRPVVLSAAVFPNCRNAPKDVGQDWMTWCKKGYMDMVVPMFYNKDTEVVLNQIALAQRDLPLDVILYAGIAVYNQPLGGAADKAIKARRAGVHGICFFPYDTLAETPGSLRKLSVASFGGAVAGSGSGAVGKTRQSR